MEKSSQNNFFLEQIFRKKKLPTWWAWAKFFRKIVIFEVKAGIFTIFS